MPRTCGTRWRSPRPPPTPRAWPPRRTPCSSHPRSCADAANDATELLRLAAAWPVGTVVERRGDEIRVRRFPSET
ncbi:DUF7715 family protein [Amycolatopsis australiensis]|uniref:DUF7715 family protein n=1 Tax=Amycolatopsis australiensis TaxID=546364 RepID=UPI003CCC3B79